MRDGLPLPPRIQNAPELQIGLEIYFEAFWELTTDRPAGMGINPIPWSSIQRYGEVSALDEEQVDDLFYFVRCMDKAYIEWWDRKNGSGKGA